jgi:large subunit ribosomal protein L14e
MMEIGRLCVKIAGRDAGKRCVVVDVLADGQVMIDGETRRRKCNILHLEPTREVLKLKKGASHAEVAAAFKAKGIAARESKPSKAGPKPVSARRAKQAPSGQAKPAAPAKKAAKKE